MPATKEEVAAFMAAEFPQSKCVVEAVGDDGATVSHHIGPGELRPGGTVSGPVLMGVADVALYVAILGKIGIVPLAVTTSLTINFLRKPSADAHIIADCKLMKVGRTLAVGEVSLYSKGSSEPVAHVVGTYSIPPKRDSQDFPAS
ncbi:PaaI family thioesterase [Pseudogulbenkiania subflava]|uniref:Acyl-coenzyme A thioesterase PaaI, contains HGG motif n=1 Tax=Pseudogulbenkiania subflava DSM 22618 TaxID=1123014 RepID=A0A1Y6C432_9NEIS|nr:PaaI family thioesterase [Pseudogulbenkiania subflava]SMF44512.1 Acyl-coenzyme A thioesterase PaaI, contains HGG motif [Pseudogulbenkiania subflava DSM 22618]